MDRPTILIMGADSDLLEEAGRKAARAGRPTIAVTDQAIRAVEVARERRPDLVLVDLALEAPPSRRNGSSLGRVLSRELGVPVVYIVDPSRNQDVDWDCAGDSFGIVTSPIRETELELTLRVALEGFARETRLRTTGALLSTVFQAFPSPMVVVEDDGIVTLCNQKAQQTFGIDCDDSFPRPLDQVIRCVEHDAGKRCACSTGSSGCEVVRIVREALGGAVIENRRCELGLLVGGTPRRVVLSISAIGFEHAGRRRAILILEDATEFERLRHLYGDQHTFSGIVGRSDVMRRIFETIREVAEVEMPVLIQGETGTGKELVARAIHDHGARSDRSFVPVNCGAIPEGLLESELFGHVKGAFTGAVRERQGRFTLANGGTIFLDEIGDLSPSVQVKLLRVLQEGTYEPVGSERTLTADVRVISATNKDLAVEVAAGRFRKDLYYRLCVLPIDLPPLRDRAQDLPLIAEHLLKRAALTDRTEPASLSDEALELLLDHSWTGNVRELDNVLQFARMKCRNGLIRPEHLPPSCRTPLKALATPAPRTETASAVRKPLDRGTVAAAIAQAGGNRTRAAQLLGVSRATLYRFLSSDPS